MKMELGDFLAKSWYWILTIVILVITSIAGYWKQIRNLLNKNQDTVHEKDISALRTEQSKDHQLQDQKIEFTDKLASAHLENVKLEIDNKIGKHKGKIDQKFLEIYAEIKVITKLQEDQLAIAESNQEAITKLTSSMAIFKDKSTQDELKIKTYSSLLEKSSGIMSNLTDIIEVKGKLDKIFPLLETIAPFIPKWTSFMQKTIKDLTDVKSMQLSMNERLDKQDKDLMKVKTKVNIP